MWPILLLLGLQWRKLGWILRLSAVVIFAACVASPIIYAPAYGNAYTLPSSWAVTILIGAAAYFVQGRVATWLPQREILPVGAAVTVLLATSVIPELKESTVAYLLGGPATAVLAVVIINYVRGPQAVLRPMKPMLRLGAVSYAAYLWNLPVTLWLEAADVPLTSLLSLMLTITAAAASWFAVERPTRDVKWRIQRRERGLSETEIVVSDVQQLNGRVRAQIVMPERGIRTFCQEVAPASKMSSRTFPPFELVA